MSNASPAASSRVLPSRRYRESLANFEQVRVSSADHQRERRKFDHVLADYGVDMAFDVIYRNQRQVLDQRERFRVSHAYQQRSHQAGTLRHRNRRKVIQPRQGLFERHPHGGNNGAQMFARSEFRHHAAIFRMRRHLGGNDRRENPRAVFNHRCRSLIARRFNAKNSHLRSLTDPFGHGSGSGDVDAPSRDRRKRLNGDCCSPTSIIPCPRS